MEYIFYEIPLYILLYTYIFLVCSKTGTLAAVRNITRIEKKEGEGFNAFAVIDTELQIERKNYL